MPATGQHQAPPSEAIDRRDSDERGHEVDGPGGHDVEHDRIDAVARLLENLLGIIEEHIDTADCSKHGQEHAQRQDFEHPRLDQIESGHLHLGGADGPLDVVNRVLGIFPAADAGETRRARSRRRSDQPQRGLSGSSTAPMKNKSEGIVTAVNIQRQAYWPFHDWRMNSAVALSGILRAIRQLMICRPARRSRW